MGRWPNSARNASGSSCAGDMWKLNPAPASVASSRAARHSGSEAVLWPTSTTWPAMRPPATEPWRSSTACRLAMASSVFWRYTSGSGGRSHTQRPTRPRIPTSASPSTTSSRNRTVPASRKQVVPERSISVAASCAEMRSSAAV